MPRRHLIDLSHALCELHRALVASVQLGFERLHGRVPGRGALLELVLHDPLFAWLRPLSALIASIDERLETDVDGATLALARRAVEGVLAAGDFADRYRVLLQEDAAVVMAHGALRRALAGLPSQEERTS
jgi:hypothetical protein